jgi:hypothetical protein
LSVSEKIAIETALAKAHNISKDIGSFQSDVDSAYDALMALLPVEEELPFVRRKHGIQMQYVSYIIRIL